MAWLERRIPPPLVGGLVAAAMWGIAETGPQFDYPASLRHAAVGLLAVAGAAFDLLGLLAFRALRTTINPLRPERSTALAVRGVYRVTRNPMYLGMAFLLLAWAVYLAALLPLAGPAVFVLYITRFQILPEERVLRGLFGESYAAYAARVRRWL
jgi:protein-S-isoprenylcysteine O-methyltransferase Ste14